LDDMNFSICSIKRDFAQEGAPAAVLFELHTIRSCKCYHPLEERNDDAFQ
jgi:hypothetical protein